MALIVLGVLCALASIPIALFGWPGLWGINPYPCRSDKQPTNRDFHGETGDHKLITYRETLPATPTLDTMPHV